MVRQYQSLLDLCHIDLIRLEYQVNHALITLHIDNLRGVNAHHQAETIFKAFGRALRMAVTLDERQAGVINAVMVINLRITITFNG
jgi:imidazoleglycerol-phosphate dehydratase